MDPAWYVKPNDVEWPPKERRAEPRARAVAAE
jgi:hypothetical protein